MTIFSSFNSCSLLILFANCSKTECFNSENDVQLNFCYFFSFYSFITYSPLFLQQSEVHYGYRRQFTVLGSAFFYCGHLVSSHLAREDLRDVHLYVQSLGILDLSVRCSMAQLVAWREVHPTRQCHDVAEINNSFGYSEPNARWCLLIVGLVR